MFRSKVLIQFFDSTFNLIYFKMWKQKIMDKYRPRTLSVIGHCTIGVKWNRFWHFLPKIVPKFMAWLEKNQIMKRPKWSADHLDHQNLKWSYLELVMSIWADFFTYRTLSTRSSDLRRQLDSTVSRVWCPQTPILSPIERWESGLSIGKRMGVWGHQHLEIWAIWVGVLDR